jgi:hypothetical protein
VHLSVFDTVILVHGYELDKVWPVIAVQGSLMLRPFDNAVGQVAHCKRL